MKRGGNVKRGERETGRDVELRGHADRLASAPHQRYNDSDNDNSNERLCPMNDRPSGNNVTVLPPRGCGGRGGPHPWVEQAEAILPVREGRSLAPAGATE